MMIGLNKCYLLNFHLQISYNTPKAGINASLMRKTSLTNGNLFFGTGKQFFPPKGGKTGKVKQIFPVAD